MDKSKSEASLADIFLNGPSSPDNAPLPMPRFGKTPLAAERTRSLSTIGRRAAGKVDDAHSLCWLDEDDLGIRVFILEEQGSQGIEVCAFVEGVRPGLLGKEVSVALTADKEDRMARLTILLDQPSDEHACSGKGSFGDAAKLRNKLGDKVWLDVFMLE